MKVSIFLKLTYRFHAIPINIPGTFFCKRGKIIQKSIWEVKETRTAKTILQKKNKMREISSFLRFIAGTGSLVPAGLWSALGHIRMGHGLGTLPRPEMKGPAQLVLGLSPHRGLSSLFQAQGMFFCLYLKLVHHMAPWPNPLSICPPWGRDRVLPLWHRKGKSLCVSHWERPAGHRGLMSTIEANLAWSLLYVSEALFHPVLGGTVFLLVTLIPRCSGHRCLDFSPWWLAS